MNRLKLMKVNNLYKLYDELNEKYLEGNFTKNSVTLINELNKKLTIEEIEIHLNRISISKNIDEFEKSSRDKLIEKLWGLFSNGCVDEDDNIDEEFFIWKKGSSRYSIWGWFNNYYSKGVRYLIYEFE